MKKIISLFQRNYDGDRLVRDELVPGAEWVANGEGVATQKFDGTSCLVRDGKLFKRYEIKKGRTAPEGFEAAQDQDKVTGDVTGWVPVGIGPEDQWHREAFAQRHHHYWEDGTYELCGPKVQGNPEGFKTHILIRHGNDELPECPRTHASLKAYLATANIEGVVWHHPDGRMVKIKAKDFGLKRTQSCKEPDKTD